ncbi:MAG TPA: hypothetical protein VFV65_03840 [Gemmatimonadales bacterium]|nr:hypothetical protein [Gemmatimonadales bacterium]
MPSNRFIVRDVLPVGLAGAGLGCWMFSFRGLLLFLAIGVGLSIAIRLVVTHTRHGGVAFALALVVAAAAFGSASRLGWGAADAHDGTRYKVSPVGLSHVLTPHQPVSETIDCGWYPLSGYAAPCAIAPGGAAAFRLLRAVFPLLVAAVACCLLGVLVAVAGPSGMATSRRVLSSIAALSGLSALVLFANSCGAALADLRGLRVGTGGTLGTMQLTTAILLCLAVRQRGSLPSR